MIPQFFQTSTTSQGWLRLLLMGTAALLFSACVAVTPPPAVTPQSVPTEQPAATATPISTATPTSTPEAPAAPAADVAELPQIFADILGITPVPDSDSWQSVEVLPLTPELWATFTTGLSYNDPPKKHAVAIFTQKDGSWVELGQVELECSGFVADDSVQQVSLDPASVWLTVDSGAGAHSGCFDLLRWDGSNLTIAVSGFNSFPGVGEVRDVDGDGQPEVVLNATDPYVFCYACGVRLFGLTIQRWDGTQFLPVELTSLPEDTTADLREANNRAVELAGASLFPDALPLIDEALSLAPKDERVYWNSQLIHALAQGRKEYTESTPYPLLSWMFYGDWAAAQAELNAYTPAQIFDPEMALLQETAASGWEDTLADWILQFSGPALAAEPELAPAWFLQGWAKFLKDPSDPGVLADVKEAARLAPDEQLFQDAVEYLSSQSFSQSASNG
ncbi:MAG: hypothetical protein KF753_21260 [Caldilineaceae bacterium]|nr:hypothetical protein [Caldilineaceae bacterium]